jgi:hypothetical protein
MNIVAQVQRALENANSEQISITDAGPLHKERSRLFVEHLATLLRDHFHSEEGVKVLSKHFEGNRSEFGLNELLFDVLVCETATVESPVNQVELTYVTAGLWAIESEFATDLREALYDFNKLVLSSAENCLLIGPMVSNNEGFLDSLSGAAGKCKGTVYVVFVPHPSDWADISKLQVQGHVWKETRWQAAPA